MNNLREDFLKFVCQTSEAPIGLALSRAEGCLLFDMENQEYLDCISGIAVANVGHNHPDVKAAVHRQIDRYDHVMVYGEYLLEPQIEYARALAEIAPGNLSVTFFANSGAEAVEGALKTARKITSRSKIISFINSYHGDTMGALSVMGNEMFRQPFQPLLREVQFFPFNDPKVFEAVNSDTAAVIVEPVQGEAGVLVPESDFLLELRLRCTESGALLIFDEVQTGFGRTGKMFACEHWNVAPDIMVMAKAMGGGLPLGGFIGSTETMSALSQDPPFSHVTTFGGNPVCCAAGLAALNVIQRERLLRKAKEAGDWLRKGISEIPSGGKILEVRGLGLLMAIEFAAPELAESCVRKAFEHHIILGGMLQAPKCVRLAPPLIVTKKECNKIITVLNKIIPNL